MPHIICHLVTETACLPVTEIDVPGCLGVSRASSGQVSPGSPWDSRSSLASIFSGFQAESARHGGLPGKCPQDGIVELAPGSGDGSLVSGPALPLALCSFGLYFELQQYQSGLRL